MDQSCSFTSPEKTAWGRVGDWTDPRDAGVAASCCVQAWAFFLLFFWLRLVGGGIKKGRERKK